MTEDMISQIDLVHLQRDRTKDTVQWTLMFHTETKSQFWFSLPHYIKSVTCILNIVCMWMRTEPSCFDGLRCLKNQEGRIVADSGMEPLPVKGPKFEWSVWRTLPLPMSYNEDFSQSFKSLLQLNQFLSPYHHIRERSSCSHVLLNSFLSIYVYFVVDRGESHFLW